jgi:hypothetical protein
MSSAEQQATTALEHTQQPLLHACLQCGHCTKTRQGAHEHKKLYCASWKRWRDCGEVHEFGTFELPSMCELVRKHVRCNVVPPRGNEDGRIRKRGSVRGAYWAVMKKVFMDKPHNMSVRVVVDDKGVIIGAIIRRKQQASDASSASWHWERVDCDTATRLVHEETLRILGAVLEELVHAQRQRQRNNRSILAPDAAEYKPPLAGHVDARECAAQLAAISQYGGVANKKDHCTEIMRLLSAQLQ